jgi:hypothetical protein
MPLFITEACSGFTHVTAHRIAQPPKATFVTRLQPFRSPGRAARQLPDQSTILWVESSSTSDPRLRGALPTTDIPATRLPSLSFRTFVVRSVREQQERSFKPTLVLSASPV